MEKQELFLINNWQELICDKCDKENKDDCSVYETSCPYWAQAQKIENLQDSLIDTIQETLGNEFLHNLFS